MSAPYLELCFSQVIGAGIVSGSASAEYTDLALIPGGTGLLATTADARLLFLTPSSGAGSSGEAVAAAGPVEGLKLTRQLIGTNDEVRRDVCTPFHYIKT